MATTTEYPPDWGVFDLHTHLSLKTYLFKRKFWRTHTPPGRMFPLCMRTDLDALLAGDVKVLLCSIYVLEKEMWQDNWVLRHFGKLFPVLRHQKRTPYDVLTFEYFDEIERVLAETCKRRGDLITLARSYPEMQEAIAAGKICVLNSLEGAHHLNGNLDNLERFYERGVCHIILSHFYPNEIGDCVDPIPENLPMRKIGCFTFQRDLESGLTEWGRSLVDRMLDLGVIVDTCHATPLARRQILAQVKQHPKKRPVIMSHVGVHEYAATPMNPTRDEIRAIADTGGTIGIIFMPYWLHQPKTEDIETVLLKTIDHLIQYGGEEVVSFGSDFDGFTEPPAKFKSPRDYNRLRTLLATRYSEQQIAKFLNGNAHRVLREGWGKGL